MTLLEFALLYARAGISVIPIDHRTKKPKGEWKEYQGRRAEERELKSWLLSGSVKSIAAVCGKVSGGLLVIDFDVPGFYEEWADAAGELAQDLPVQRTGGGGYQVFFRCPEPGGNQKLAFSPKEEAVAGREIAIETRGEGGYVVVPPSLHPSGNYYQWISHGPVAEPVEAPFTIPLVSQARADALLDAARKLDRAPFTRQEQAEQDRRMQAAKPRQRSGDNGEVSIIDAFNRAHDIETILMQYGYTHCGRYLSRPGVNRPSVVIHDNKSFHFSTNDLLNGSHLVDPFEVYLRYEHGGDIKSAVRTAAELLGLKRSGGRENKTNVSGASASPGASPEQPKKSTPNGDIPQEAGITGDAFHYTDTGNARRLIRAYGHMIRYNQEPYGKWLWWNGRFWQFDRTNKIFEYVDHVITDIYREASENDDSEWRKKLVKLGRDLEGMSGQRNLVKKAETIQDISVCSDALDSHAWLFNCRNMTLDLSNGEVKPHQHSQEDYLTRTAEVDYVTDAKCPRWEKFLTEIFEDDSTLIQFIQRAVGYSLTGDISEQCLFFAYGTGKNGKTVFFNTIELLFGEYFYKAPADMILQQKYNNIPSDVAQMKGKRFVVTSEIEDNRRLAEARVKNLTGGDTIEARPMYKEWFTFKPTHKLWMFGNHKPLINGTDEGMWRRVRVIPFTVCIPEEKRRPMRELLAEFSAELSGILNWALAGYEAYCEKGFIEPARMQDAQKQYRDENDIIGRFIEECCTIHRELSVNGKSLWQAYHGWCDDLGEHSITSQRLYSKLRERGYEVKAGTGNKTFVYGITLNS